MAPKAETPPKVEELENVAAAKKCDVSYEDEASFLQGWTLGFLTPILRFGATKALEVGDLGVVR